MSPQDWESFNESLTGPLEYSRLGLVGWITYWSLGNSVIVLKIIVGLIRKVDMTDSVFGSTVAMTSSDHTMT